MIHGLAVGYGLYIYNPYGERSNTEIKWSLLAAAHNNVVLIFEVFSPAFLPGLCLEVETLEGSPRDERLSFGACTPVSQHTPLVSRIARSHTKAGKSSTNRVCVKADPAWPSAPSAVADPTKP